MFRNNKVICLCLLLVFFKANLLYSNEIGISEGDSINQLSKEGKKEGYWVENKSKLRFESYYKNDLLDGLFKSYYQNNVISSFGFYSKGNKVGKWCYFDEIGRLILEQSNIKKGEYNVKTVDGQIEFKNSSYIKFYYSDGKLREEGNAYYNDIEEHIQKYGAWKSYGMEGKIIKVKLKNNNK